MKKQEFLDILRSSLSDNIPDKSIQPHIDFYKDYIENEVRTGKTEDEVIDSIGNPRLIAKTIINTNENDVKNNDYSYQDSRDGQDYTSDNKKIYNRGRFGSLIGLIFIVIFILLLFSIMGGIFFLIIRFAMPIILVMLIYTVFRKLR